ncbi:MAG: phosphate ABC transporter permease PstA [Negativicutes bacterium]|jgi:phosphate transport system permease protein
MKKTKLSEKLIYLAIYLSAALSLTAMLAIIGYIVFKGAPIVDWTFLTSPYKGAEHGIYPMIVTTLYMIVVSLAVSAPIGICSAIYLNEYAKAGKLVRIIRFATDSLSGIPSIIYGLFGYMFFVTALQLKMSILSGSLTLAIMVLPLVIRTTEEALKTVPMAYREGSLALGASKISTIFRIVLPSAAQGIITAIILSTGRIVGETAAVYLTAGMVTRVPGGIMESGRTLAVHLYVLAKEGISFEQAYASATVLLVIIAVLNILAVRLASGIRKRMLGN